MTKAGAGNYCLMFLSSDIQRVMLQSKDDNDRLCDC